MDHDVVTSKLINLLREFNELPTETKQHIFTQAGMTDSEFTALRMDVDTLEDDIEAYIKDNQTMDDLINSFDATEILGYLLKDDITIEDLNAALTQAHRDGEMIVMKLVSFDDLNVPAQQFAIKAHKAAVKLSDKESGANLDGEKRPNITSDECREELSRGIYQFFTDGHLYDTDNL
jgi:hypothetical protein